jgi:hypothetical protein
MSDLTSFSVISGAVVPSSARSLARVEKPSSSNSLHNESSAEEGQRERAAGRIAPKRLSRSETDGAPVWYGPRLSSPFVAQILGQVLPHSGPDALTVRAAYRNAPALFPTGICFDNEV